MEATIMTDTQAELILGILHHLSEQIDTMRGDLGDVKVQTALNTSTIIRHTEQTTTLQTTVATCRATCDSKIDIALQGSRYIKWFSVTSVGACTVLIALFEIFNRIK